MINIKRTIPKETESKKSILLKIAPILLTIIIIILGLIYFITQRNDTYRINTQEYKPELSIIKCKWTKFNFEFPPIELKPASTQALPVYDTETIDLPITATLSFDLVLKNISNNNAHLLLGIYTDTTTGDRYLAKMKDKEFKEFLKSNNPEYYSDIQVQSQQEFPLHINSRINFLSENMMFTFHIWLVYKNDMDMIYDTYYWYRGKIDKFSLGINPNTNEIIYPKGEIVHLVDTNEFFHTYTKKEYKKMINFFPDKM